MGQTKPAAGLKSLNRAADTLSTLLAQEVKELNERQKAARRENTPVTGSYNAITRGDNCIGRQINQPWPITIITSHDSTMTRGLYQYRNLAIQIG